MTDLEKNVYNCWLATTRSQTNKPFKLRKTWENFEENPHYIQILKLAKIFKKYDNIEMSDWFKAPYIVWHEKVIHPLSYYTSMKQFNVYRLYIQQKHNKKYTSSEFKKIICRNTK